MSKNISFSFVFVILILQFGCASKNFREPEETSRSARKPASQTFNHSYGVVWKTLLDALEAEKYPVAETQRDSGLIVTDWILGKSDRLYSGYGDNRIPYNIRFKLTVRFRPSQKGITVSIQGQEQYYTDVITAGTDFRGSLYQWIPTKSSGAKETRLLRKVTNRLTSGK